MHPYDNAKVSSKSKILKPWSMVVNNYFLSVALNYCIIYQNKESVAGYMTESW